jgi:hypothetical protein
MAEQQTQRGLTLCGAVAPVVFTAAWVTAGLVQKGYSVWQEDISALAALDAEHPWIMIDGLAAAGSLTIAFAAGLSYRIPRSRTASALVALAGLGLIALAFLRNDCSAQTDPCKDRIAAGAVSWHHHAHDVLSGPVFAAAVVAPLLLAARFRADDRVKALAPYSIATAAVVAVIFAVGGLDAFPAWDGVVQRAGVSVAFLWMELTALRLFSLGRHGGRSSTP